MVAADSPHASRAGADVLAAGGNAFDAAVATSLALAVTRPDSTGLGGGGFLVAYLAKENHIVVLDFRETAPAAATPQRYAELLAAGRAGPPPTLYGGNAVGVPGLLAGLEEIRRRHGTWEWAKLAPPAVRLAEEGFPADEHYVEACRDAVETYERWPQLKTRCPRLYETLLNRGVAPKAGDLVKRLDLAAALRLIGEQGSAAFYDGPLGETVVQAVNDAGGRMARADLAAYRVREREPLRFPYGDFEIVTMPPPSSGGVCIAEMLNILRGAADRSDLTPAEAPHVLVEAMKHAFADRARWLGDPDFGSVPVERLTSVKYAAELSRRIRPGKTLASDQYGSSPPTTQPRDGGTSHFCVADRLGNLIAMTETINGTFGSFVVTERFGIILNNQMDDFAAEPGKPNLFGLVQGEANAIAPGKRPLSSMSPTLVLENGRPVLALGGSGGPRIISSVLQVMRNVMDGGMTLERAVAAPRLHHQWLPDEVYFDQAPSAELERVLKSAGHKLGEKRKTGIVQAIQRLDDGTLVGASDPHRGGRPSGVK